MSRSVEWRRRLGVGVALATLVASGVTAGAVSAGKGGGSTSWTPPSGMFGGEVAWRTGVEPLWDLGYTGAGIDVAVIDTGVNAVPGLDGRGKIVDGPDFSFDSDTASLRYRDLYGHGTAMASLVGGTSQGTALSSVGNTTMVGMAPGARIVNVKVGDGVGAVDVSQVIAAIDWVTQHRNDQGMNIRVMLLAFDTDSTQSYLLDPLAYAVENAWAKGITVVVAAGNDGKNTAQLGNPAFDPYVIAVGAVELSSNGQFWKVPGWASSGDGTRNPDLSMPGNQLLAAAVPGSYLAQKYPTAVFDSPQGKLIRGNGTSQAAALAAGAAATLLQARPTLTPDQVKAALRQTAQYTGIPDKFGGAGLVDADYANMANVTGAVQTWPRSSGLGTLEAARGSYHVGPTASQLVGETTAFGDTWAPVAWTTATKNGVAYTNETWSKGTWVGGAWLGSTWSGSTWSGSTWSGSTWSGSTWSGSTWSGSTWSGASWSGSTWSGASWSGSTWSGASWSGSTWSGASWA